MKNLYQKQFINLILQENPVVFITNSDKNTFNTFSEIKNKKVKNLILQEYHKNVFNGVIYLIYGKNVYNLIKSLNAVILGVFIKCGKTTHSSCIISFQKFKNIYMYVKPTNMFNSLVDVLSGQILWLLLKTTK